MKQKLSFVIIVLLMIFVTVCDKENDNLNIIFADTSSKFNFLSYESDDIYNIELLSLKECATYKFKYTSDNYKIEGYISIPLECIENQIPTKCILYNRGGNSKIGLLDENYTEKICLETSRIVIASQYRGAGGNEGVDQFGGDDLNDVIKLIDLCENTFEFVDMNDFCSLGVSRGGMMTFMAARQDDRIKKIIAVSAVSNLIDAYNERDDMKTILNNYIGSSPDYLPKEYEKRSAIFWADEIKVPVLLIHSRYDESVSFYQSEALYEKLKENAVDCSLIIHEDSVHGFHADDKNEILDFLE